MELDPELDIPEGKGQNPDPSSGGKKPRVVNPEMSEMQKLLRSAAGFILGLILASLYGVLVLLAQGHNIKYCLVTTIGLGAALGLGMAFSIGVRVTVLLSLPHVFTKEGKALMLLLALGIAVQGPCTNILYNFSQSAQSLSCGAELALNQTAERMHRAQEPLLNMLNKIKEISQKAKVVGDHVRKFFRSIMDSVGHVAQALQNVWMWLQNVGFECNAELGKPYQRCQRLFTEAYDKCMEAIPILFFLCYIIPGFQNLCGLANVGYMFCIIPHYIQEYLRRRTVDPGDPSPSSRGCPFVTPTALTDKLDDVRREFEFNITAVHHFDVNLNASKSLGEVALDIMEGVRLSLEPVYNILALFTHFSFFAIVYIYLRALQYRHQYLRDDTFDNVYITQRFLELDLRCAEQGRPTVLPLSSWESGRYILPAGMWLSRQEQRRYGLQLVGVLRHMLLGLCIILADYSLFWLLDLVQHHLQGEIVARAPEVLGISINGTGYTSEIFRDVVSAFDALQRGNISVISQRCRLQPVEPDYGTYLNMGLLYGTCIFIAVFGTHAARLRRVVCAVYYPSREQERTIFLHRAILARRAGLARALRKAVTENTGDTEQNEFLQYLTARLPVFAWLVRFLGIQQKRCLACGMQDQADLTACITPGCKGLYCSECHETLNDICAICMGPLSYEELKDEEMDSSDEETVRLWLGAVQALQGQERGRLLQQRIREVAGGQGGGRRLPPEMMAQLRTQLVEEAGGESDKGSTDSSLSSRDFGYQEEPESSSELEEVTAQQPPSSPDRTG
ncbi:DC-STAMP domain-containing protein 2 [Calypte anna]|uniref:DC-STAMP domain-containing protein 2 n=1 Tax=Calypte anna TaxID=9244 RepID=UPI0011C34387|nr:DC-STAMP domain-containing protein 2 [Calypte anna]